MRCHICDRIMSPTEIKFNKNERGGMMPCNTCIEESEGLFIESEEELDKYFSSEELDYSLHVPDFIED